MTNIANRYMKTHTLPRWAQSDLTLPSTTVRQRMQIQTWNWKQVCIQIPFRPNAKSEIIML